MEEIVLITFRKSPDAAERGVINGLENPRARF